MAQPSRRMGFNHVRLPFSYRHFETDDRPGQWREEGFQLLDRMIGWCRQHGLWVLLDLHSAGLPGLGLERRRAPRRGASCGTMRTSSSAWRICGARSRGRYRDEPTVMAYEVLNEPVTSFPHQVARA